MKKNMGTIDNSGICTLSFISSFCADKLPELLSAIPSFRIKHQKERIKSHFS